MGTSTGQPKGEESKDSAKRKETVRDAFSDLAVMWNMLDNCYGAVQRLQADQPARDANLVKADQLYRALGVYPHQEDGKAVARRLAMALIEDRTRYIRELKDVNRLQPFVMKIKGDELAALKSSTLVAQIVANELDLSEEQAVTWVDYLLDPASWLRDQWD